VIRFRTLAKVTLVVCSSVVAGCGGDSSSPSPTAPSSTPSRIIAVSGNLAFGDVLVGQSKSSNFTVQNSGTSMLTVTGLSVTGGLASHSTVSSTNFTVPAGGSVNVTLNFAPTAAGVYSGTLSVNGDHTGGSNTIAISGTGVAANPFSGFWTGNYIVEQCNGTGSIQDIFCSANRGIYPVGSSLPISMSLTQNGTTVSGPFALGSVVGVANGVVSPSGVLTLQGTATSGQVTATITTWSTRVDGDVMTGNVTYNLTLTGTPGVAVVVTRLGRVTK
jgi:hypothetical protein